MSNLTVEFKNKPFKTKKCRIYKKRDVIVTSERSSLTGTGNFLDKSSFALTADVKFDSLSQNRRLLIEKYGEISRIMS